MSDVSKNAGTNSRHGPQLTPSGIRYRLWTPQSNKVSVLIKHSPSAQSRQLNLSSEPNGWFSILDSQGHANDLYEFVLNDAATKIPDVASRFQPQGVRGPSQAINGTNFPWTDQSWKSPALADLVIYELHVGTFTEAGTFTALIEHLDHLRKLGATAIQVMPVGAFPGDRNWGYDVVLPYAPAHTYGTPDELRRLVNAAHQHGLAVIMDVVYNHVCGEPNILYATTPQYFRKEGGNAWGSSLNFDEPAVRAFFLQNVEYWFDDFHLDGLRLDATHAVVDHSPVHVLQEIADAAHCRGRFVIAEDDRNEVQLLKPTSAGGLGLDAVWADDFHHVLKMALKPEPIGHFKSYQGSKTEMVATLDHGWLFRGQHFAQWQKPRGTEPRERPPNQFVYCISNHDQTGNRPIGERLNHLVSAEAYRAASMFFLLLPYTPMLFMGQEWGASTPFVFFTNHEGSFGSMVSEGRLKEFKHFGSEWPVESIAAMPDPEKIAAFTQSKLTWAESTMPEHQRVFELYRQCLYLRAHDPILHNRDRSNWKVWTDDHRVFMQYGLKEKSFRLLIANLEEANSDAVDLPEAKLSWKKLFSSNEKLFGGKASNSLDQSQSRYRFTVPETVLLGCDS